ncbi:MAG: hypothetical protein IJX47_09995 [Clostridia bacterium]|nr:hypothetical protein [Clostridia bacterium]
MNKLTRNEEINQTLANRRKLMHRRILIGRILLGVWAASAVINLIFLFGSATLRFYLSSVTADLLMMLRIVYPDSVGAWIAIAFAVAIPCLLVTAAVFWKQEFASPLRTAAFLLLWLDVIVGVWVFFWNPVLVFGDGSNRTAVILINLALHILLIWHISRARRAVTSLEILPEAEIEGDPFEEFRRRDDGEDS